MPYTFFLLDTMALIYRAHFAFSKSPRINSKGFNTSAVFGFTNYLLEIIQKQSPTHLLAAFDTPEPTWRHQTYAAYKAQRQAQPEDITMAIPYVKKILTGFGIPIISIAGYEADDIIGTFVCKLAKENWKVYMVTPDKDFAQLVNDNIYLYRPAFMGHGVAILDTNAVLKKWEIQSVDQIRDLLALQGDAVDNIPGIPGIGAKTAQKLIAQYGSIEAIIENVSALKGKLKENITQYAQQGRLSKELATIHCDVPIGITPEEAIYRGPNEKLLQNIFQELEFQTISARLFGDEAYYKYCTSNSTPTIQELQSTLFSDNISTKRLLDKNDTFFEQEMTGSALSLRTLSTTPHQYQLVNTPQLRQELIGLLTQQTTFCFDTETTSLDPYKAKLVGISFAFIPREAYYVPIPKDQNIAQQIVDEFRPLFENEHQYKIAQNIKYDSLVLRKYGILLKGLAFDTMLAHALVAPERPHNMNAMAANYLQYAPIQIEQLIGNKKTTQLTMRDVPLLKIKDYACEDADITLQLKQVLEPMIDDEGVRKLFDTIEMPLVTVLIDMEYTGVRIDLQVLQEISHELILSLDRLEAEIKQFADFDLNLNSPKQLGTLLFDRLKLAKEPKKTKTGQYVTNELVLATLEGTHPIIEKILQYRGLQKLKSTYVDALPKLLSPYDQKLHTSYNQTIVVTGRLSSSQPNLQNIPIRKEKGKNIRKAFIPNHPQHVLLSADYSQIELRIMAAFSQDPTLIEAFNTGKDIHAATASKLFNVPEEAVNEQMRRQAKTANFGIIYGISSFGLAQRLSISRSDASELIKSYFQEFPAVKTYMDSIIQQGREKGFVTTYMGRKKYLRDINSRNASLRAMDERNAINAPIQGTAAEMIKLAMIHIHRWLEKEKMESKLILQVHDELVLDVPEKEVDKVSIQVNALMKDALPLKNVPVEVHIGIGKNWAMAH